jgi:hypothetical protein
VQSKKEDFCPSILNSSARGLSTTAPYQKVTMAESATEIKLFGKWSLDDVEINDISLVVIFSIIYVKEMEKMI